MSIEGRVREARLEDEEITINPGVTATINQLAPATLEVHCVHDDSFGWLWISGNRKFLKVESIRRDQDGTEIERRELLKPEIKINPGEEILASSEKLYDRTVTLFHVKNDKPKTESPTREKVRT